MHVDISYSDISYFPLDLPKPFRSTPNYCKNKPSPPSHLTELIKQLVSPPFPRQGILESSQTCAPSTPDTLSALLWAILAVFGIVYALLGYRCLRAVGFLSGLMVGANGIFILQDFQITWLGKPADSALAIVAGLLGAVLGSTYPVASVLISAFAGALLSGAAMAVCVATMPDNEFGVSTEAAARGESTI